MHSMDKEVDLSGWTKSVAKDMKQDYLTAQLTAEELKTVLMLRMLPQDAQ